MSKIINKKSIVLVISIFILIILFTLMLIRYYRIPDTNTIIELRNITREEYESNLELRKYDFNNIKKLYVEVNITNSKYCIKREIMIPDLNAIDSYDKVRSIISEDSKINNLNKDDKAQSIKYIIFDAAGLTIDNIKSIFSKKIIIINIITPNKKDVQYNYDLGAQLKVSQ